MNLEYEIVDKKDVNEYMNSLIIMIVQLILIPYLVYFMSRCEDWKTKSARTTAVTNRNYTFMVINLVILNLTGLTTIKALIWAVHEEEL